MFLRGAWLGGPGLVNELGVVKNQAFPSSGSRRRGMPLCILLCFHLGILSGKQHCASDNAQDS